MTSYLRSFWTKQAFGQMARLAIIGVGNTVLYFALINIFRTVGIDLLPRTVLAFAMATAMSFVLNRRWTFKIRRGHGHLRESLAFFGVNLVALVVTAGIVLAADALRGPDPLTRLEENLANLVAGGLLLLPKLAALRDLVFKRSLTPPASQAAEPHRGRVPSDLP
ncbi:MAG TPA: GtrA family protein [Acidimicrobiia bacterium]|nr:GtrA family protein [Acidimicrobiia bacterium]